jgi:hypothetical protein
MILRMKTKKLMQAVIGRLWRRVSQACRNTSSLHFHYLEPAGFVSGSKAQGSRQFPALNEQHLFEIDPHAIRHPLTLQGYITPAQ